MHVNIKVNLMVENVIQIKSGMTANVGRIANTQKKHSVCKKNIFGILLHVVVKMVVIQTVLLMVQ